MGRSDSGLGAAVLFTLVLVAVLAPWLSQADPTVQYDPVNGANLAPGSRRFEVLGRDGSRLLARRVEVTPDGVAATTEDGSRLIPTESIQRTERGRITRERFFPLGTDRVGRDVWARLLHGSRVSLAVALLAAVLASLLGVIVGSAAAVGGRLADTALMRLVDGFVAFPRLFLLLALAAFLNAGPITVIVVLGATSWMSVGRLVRAELLRLKNTEMALAARASGASQLRTLISHLLPNAAAPVVVATTLRIGDVLLLEAALSFLGLGIRPPTPSWGNMIADGVPDIATAWWTSTLPGLAIVITVVAFNLVGDDLQSRLRRGPAEAS
ncbi:MAG: ABC transporter permease [bacterium]|nr:ABC transporter permease [bacterium]